MHGNYVIPYWVIDLQLADTEAGHKSMYVLVYSLVPHKSIQWIAESTLSRTEEHISHWLVFQGLCINAIETHSV